MISVEEIRERAKQILPQTVYRQYADSPTIREYTRWDVFDAAFSAPAGDVSLEGLAPARAVPHFSFNPAEHRALARHFSVLRGAYIPVSGRISTDARSGHAAIHVFYCAAKDGVLWIDDLATMGSKSVTYDVFVRDGVSIRLVHVLRSEHPHYVRLRLHAGPSSSVELALAAEGGEAHVHYEVFAEHGAKALVTSLLLGGRVDLIVDGVAGRSSVIRSSSFLLSDGGSFLVSRGLMRVPTGAVDAEASTDVAYLSSGGLAIAVPELSVDEPAVRAARHGVRNIAPSSEMLFYLASRGISPEDSVRMYLYGILAAALPEDVLGVDWVRSSISTFSESYLCQYGRE